MKTKLKPAAAICLLGLACGAALAHGDMKCPDIPKTEWKPQMELQQKLVAEGWRVRRLKVENGCYEVYALDAKGERVEAYFNPKTLGRVHAK